jgi:hypothetical protein
VVGRGGPPLEVTVTVQNTGAGHAWPTGNPWTWARVTASLVGPVGKRGERAPAQGAVASSELRRIVEETPPWRTTGDTRIPAGGQVRFDWKLAFPKDSPNGPWELVVAVDDIGPDGKVRSTVVEQRVALRVP